MCDFILVSFLGGTRGMCTQLNSQQQTSNISKTVICSGKEVRKGNLDTGQSKYVEREDSISFTNSVSSVPWAGHFCDFHLGYQAVLIVKSYLFIEERYYIFFKISLKNIW